jgi:hypothetical protein
MEIKNIMIVKQKQKELLKVEHRLVIIIGLIKVLKLLPKQEKHT